MGCDRMIKLLLFILFPAISFAAPSSYFRMPPGTILATAGTSCPTFTVAADGSTLARTGTFQNLYAAVGTTAGTGNGSTTFNVLDLRGSFPRGAITSGTIISSGTAISNAVTAGTHGFNRNGFPVRVTGTPVTGLATGVTYYAIIVSSGSLAFATTPQNAIANTRIAISGSAASMGITQYVSPDEGSRLQSNSGGLTSGVGSIQQDGFGSHSHWVFVNADAGNGTQVTASGYSNVARSGPNSYDYGITNSSSVATIGLVSPTGGNETRPFNTSVLYCIWY
jgi:microcystin-dependent protein